MASIATISATLIKARAYYSELLAACLVELKKGNEKYDTFKILYLGWLINSLETDVEDEADGEVTQAVYKRLLEAIQNYSGSASLNSNLVLPNVTIVSTGEGGLSQSQVQALINTSLEDYALLPDRKISGLLYSLVGSSINIGSGAWNIGGIQYSKGTTTSFPNIPNSSLGLQRYIKIYATTSGTILKIEGTESSIANEPTLPDNTLGLYTILVGDAGVGSPTQDLTNYATKANLNSLQIEVDNHEARVDNPHSVTKSQVGLGNVDNTSDANKPVSTAQSAADAAVLASSNSYTDTKVAQIIDSSPETLNTLNELANALGDDPNFATTIATQIGNKVDKVAGKGLSTEDYTTAEKTKLSGIATGATANDTDANLKDRASHTGTQLASTISDFNSAAIAAAPAETTTTEGALINGATSKATPVDADYIGLMDSAASNLLKKLSWANIKATLKTYFDTIYKVEIVLACSDETSDLTTGAAKVTFRMPCAITITQLYASVSTAPTGSTLVIDINEGGSTILSTKLSIDASEKTSTTAATPYVLSDSSLALDSEITIDIDQVGATVAGKGLKVTIIGTRN